MKTMGPRQLCSKCSIFGQKNSMFFPVSLPVFVSIAAVWNPKAKPHLQSESYTGVLCTMVKNNCHESLSSACTGSLLCAESFVGSRIFPLVFGG